MSALNIKIGTQGVAASIAQIDAVKTSLGNMGAATGVSMLNTKMKTLSVAMDGATASIGHFLTIASGGVAAGAIAFGGLAAHIMGVESQISKIKAVASEYNVTAVEMYRIATETGVSFEQVSATMFEIAKAGLKGEEAILAASLALKTGTINGEQYAEATNLAAIVTKTFANDALDTLEKKMNVLQYVAKETLLDMSDFELLFKHSASSAQALGVSFAELVSLQGAMAQAGLRSQIGARGMRRLLTQLLQLSLAFKNNEMTDPRQLAAWEANFTGVVDKNGMSVQRLMVALNNLSNSAEENGTMVAADLDALGLTMQGFNVAAIASLDTLSNTDDGEFIKLLNAATLAESGIGPAMTSIADGMAVLQGTAEFRLNAVKNAFLSAFSGDGVQTSVLGMIEYMTSFFITIENGEAILTEFSQMMVDFVIIAFANFGSSLGMIMESMRIILPSVLLFGRLVFQIANIFTGGMNPAMMNFLTRMYILGKIMPISSMVLKSFGTVIRANAMYTDLKTQSLMNNAEAERINIALTKISTDVKKQDGEHTKLGIQLSEASTKWRNTESKSVRKSVSTRIGSIKTKRAAIRTDLQGMKIKKADITLTQVAVKNEGVAVKSKMQLARATSYVAVAYGVLGTVMGAVITAQFMAMQGFRDWTDYAIVFGIPALIAVMAALVAVKMSWAGPAGALMGAMAAFSIGTMITSSLLGSGDIGEMPKMPVMPDMPDFGELGAIGEEPAASTGGSWTVIQNQNNYNEFSGFENDTMTGNITVG